MTKPKPTDDTIEKRPQRTKHLGWIPLNKLKVSAEAQREFRQSHSDRLLAAFDLEKYNVPTVNLRDGWYYIVDGQHGTDAYKRWLGDWEDQQVQCWVYRGLTEAEEAELYLSLNYKLRGTKFEDFRIAITAGRPEQVDIDRIVRLQGLKISQDKIDGAVSAVGTLERVYRRSDGPTLGRTLRIIRDAYGTPGLEAPIIDGVGQLCARYNGDLEDKRAVARLSTIHGGVNGLLGRAQDLRLKTGNGLGNCVAAAAVEIYNRGKGKRLPSWWRDE